MLEYYIKVELYNSIINIIKILITDLNIHQIKYYIMKSNNYLISE